MIQLGEQMTDEYVVLGGGPAIGKVRIDEATIRGEGGSNLPQLVIPIRFELDPQPPGQNLVVTQLKASCSAITTRSLHL